MLDEGATQGSPSQCDAITPDYFRFAHEIIFWPIDTQKQALWDLLWSSNPSPSLHVWGVAATKYGSSTFLSWSLICSPSFLETRNNGLINLSCNGKTTWIAPFSDISANSYFVRDRCTGLYGVCVWVWLGVGRGLHICLNWVWRKEITSYYLFILLLMWA